MIHTEQWHAGSDHFGMSPSNCDMDTDDLVSGDRLFYKCMMTSSNGNIFRVTGPLCGEFTSHRRIPLTKASESELWCSFDVCLNWINGWVNSREAGDLKRLRAHYDVIVMCSGFLKWFYSMERRKIHWMNWFVIITLIVGVSGSLKTIFRIERANMIQYFEYFIGHNFSLRWPLKHLSLL